MNIDYLRYFLDVAETKSITHAARVNFISPQGMSRAMNELEKELDCTLLVRYSNKLSLSKQGEALVPVAKTVVDQYNKLTNYAVSLSASENNLQEPSKRLSLLCQGICGLCFIPPQAIALLNTLDSPLIYREMSNSEIASALRQSKENETGKGKIAQVGIVCTFGIENQENLQYIHRLEELGYVYQPYLRTYDHCIVAKNSELEQKETLSYDDIVKHPIVSTNSVLHEVIAERFGEENIIVTSAEFKFRMRFVESGDAVSFMPAIGKLLLNDGLGNVVARDFDNTYQLEIGFIGLQQDLDSALFQNFLASLDDFYRKEQAGSTLFILC